MEAAMIPAGIPTVQRIVKNGKGGPEVNAIPVREDAMGGTITGYLANDTIVRIVNPASAESNHYRKLWNGTWQVQFDLGDKDLVKGVDGWCEENGHLYEFIPAPPPAEEITEVEVIEERINYYTGQKFLKLKKV
jgi:hypothetical protein